MGVLRAFALFVRWRIETLFAWAWCTAVGCLIEGHGSPPPTTLLLSVAAVLAICTCVYQYNDVIDAEMDRLNPLKGRRPVPSGKINRRYAMRLVYVSGVASIALSLLLGIVSFALCMAFLGLALVYTYPRTRLKKRYIVKELIIAAGYVLTTFIGGSAVGVLSPHTVFAGILFSIFVFLGYPALYDASQALLKMGRIRPWTMRPK